MVLRRALIFAFSIALAAAWAAAEPSTALQQRIKAVFLSKFPAYVEWPPNAFADPATPLVIGVTGADAIASELEQATSEAPSVGRPIRVKRLAQGEVADECCQILFVGADATAEHATRVLESVAGRAVLTVTDAAVAPPGSVINFVMVADRIRFDISRDAADGHGLKLRSQLLQVAHQVSPR